VAHQQSLKALLERIKDKGKKKDYGSISKSQWQKIKAALETEDPGEESQESSEDEADLEAQTRLDLDVPRGILVQNDRGRVPQINALAAGVSVAGATIFAGLFLGLAMLARERDWKILVSSLLASLGLAPLFALIVLLLAQNGSPFWRSSKRVHFR